MFQRPWTQTIDVPDGAISLIHNFVDEAAAELMMRTLIDETPWRQDTITMYGKTHDVPRLQQWYGGAAYTYSGIELKPLPWTSNLSMIRRDVEEDTGAKFNSVLLNYYRDGNDSVALHADDEPELGEDPVIASLSLGAERKLALYHNTKSIKIRLALPSGSLLIMRGPLQRFWRHGIPRVASLKDPRVNLTFRQLRS